MVSLQDARIKHVPVHRRSELWIRLAVGGVAGADDRIEVLVPGLRKSRMVLRLIAVFIGENRQPIVRAA